MATRRVPLLKKCAKHQNAGVRAWLQAARPLAQANIAVPLLFGELLAIHAIGRVDVTMLIIAHVFGVFDQLFIVFANDVADEEGDRLNETHNMFSGGSRVLPEAKLSSRALGIAAIVMATIMLALSGAAAALDRPAMLGGWALAVGLLWAYSYAPLRLSYRGLGELTQGIGVGLVLPLIGWYLQIGHFEGLPWLALLPCFLLAFASNISTALPDHPADVAVNKQTWPVRFGEARARKHSLQIIALGVFLSPLVLPKLDHAGLAGVEIGPALALLINLRLLPKADASERRNCRRFVFLNGLAINLALAGWIVALWVTLDGA